LELSARWRNLLSLLIVLAMLGFVPPLASTACAQPRADRSSPAAENEIRAATILFYAALNTAIHGDLSPLSAVWSHRPEVTNLNGLGGLALGWTEVRADFRNMARLYPAGQFAPPQNFVMVVVVGDIGYSVCRETGELRSSDGPMVRFDRRATNIFQREDGKWKMIHHHADATTALSQ
jgi:ketosteroid isomerase-like protein